MNTKMKLITYYTNSHKDMLSDYFLPSIKNVDEFEVIIGKGKQYSNDGSYFSEGFNQATRDKIIFILDTINKVDDNEYVMFSDCDIIFINPIREYIKNYEQYDMTFQKGYHDYNTGFFLLKNTPTVRDMLQNVIDDCHMYHDDQMALNDIIKKYSITTSMFDDRILSPAYFIYPNIWNGEELKINEDTLVFHACWCAGVDNKIRLLEYVRNYK